MASIQEVVDRAVKDAGIPAESVSFGRLADRATWRINYLPTATQAHRDAGDALLLTVDPQDAATVANIKQDLAQALADEPVATVIAQALWECIPAPTMTKLQLRTRVIALLKLKLT